MQNFMKILGLGAAACAACCAIPSGLMLLGGTVIGAGTLAGVAAALCSPAGLSVAGGVGAAAAIALLVFTRRRKANKDFACPSEAV